MSLRIDNIPTQTGRKAEASDARMDIERHDEDYLQRKKKKQNEKPDLLESIEDGTSLSTDAVLSFLKGFIATLPDKSAPATPAYKQQDTPPPQAQSFVANPNAARANRAYQTTARAVHDPNISGTQTSSDPTAAEALLGSEDIRTIYRLIDNLKQLIERDIQTLSLERAPTFLASLENAVAKATPL